MKLKHQPWLAHQQLEDTEMIAAFLEQALADATEFKDMRIFQRAIDEAAKSQQIEKEKLFTCIKEITTSFTAQDIKNTLALAEQDIEFNRTYSAKEVRQNLID